jgi:hypothetical protein
MNTGIQELRHKFVIHDFYDWLSKWLMPFLLMLVSILPGCISLVNVDSPGTITVSPMDVHVESDPFRNPVKKLGITQFSEPSYLPGAGREVAAIFQQEFLKKSVFRQTVLISRVVKSREEAIYWGWKENCDLVMFADIPYVFDGSGNQATQLKLDVEIWDVRSGRQLWYFQQNACSLPGPDVDFYWTTVAGEPAARYKVLARQLGGQAAEVLTPPDNSTGWRNWCF